MPFVPLIWIIVFVIRVILNDDPDSIAGRTGKWLNARGRVGGDRGPDMRSFRGRAGRREWWVTMVWSSLVGGFVSAIPTIGALLALPWTIATLAVTSRRLHDLTLSAWLQTIPMAIAAILLAIYGVAHYGGGVIFDRTTLDIGAAAIGVCFGAFYLFLGFAPGKRGSNCFGEADASA